MLLLQQHLASLGYDRLLVLNLDIVKSFPFQSVLFCQNPEMSDEGILLSHTYTLDEEGKFIAVKEVFTDIFDSDSGELRISTETQFFNSDAIFSSTVPGQIDTPATIGETKPNLSGATLNTEEVFSERRSRALFGFRQTMRREREIERLRSLFRFFRSEIRDFRDDGNESLSEALDLQFDSATSTRPNINRILNRQIPNLGTTVYQLFKNAINQDYAQ